MSMARTALVLVLALAPLTLAACHGPAAPAADEAGRRSVPAVDRPDVGAPAPDPDAGTQRPHLVESAFSLDTDRHSFSQELLAAHNRWRQRYGVEALSWSPAVAAHAQEWADHLAASGMQLRHRQPNPYGENLYWSKGKARTPAEVVDAWGVEERFFDPKANNWWPKAGHFSQMVWRSTRRLGCGVARSGSEEIWVCNYDPPGNIHGQRPY